MSDEHQPNDAAHTSIHRAPCGHCPSAHYPPDLESLMFQSAPRHIQLQAVFPCAWRPNKLCRGVCDSLNVTEADLAAR